MTIEHLFHQHRTPKEVAADGRNEKSKGQYTVYYEITYTFDGESMTENGAAYVWLRGGASGGCGCTNPDCGCEDEDCDGDCCTDKGCAENHRFTLLESVEATCLEINALRANWSEMKRMVTVSKEILHNRQEPGMSMQTFSAFCLRCEIDKFAEASYGETTYQCCANVSFEHFLSSYLFLGR